MLKNEVKKEPQQWNSPANSKVKGLIMEQIFKEQKRGLFAIINDVIHPRHFW